ncbi:MAG: acyl carrier protein [Gallionellaceae bacterium]|jgi:acyl carrier protein|nr:acyl carrier protein [Gallionellaceae bacterium]
MDENLALIKEFLNKSVKNSPENLTPETTFESLGLDSMSMLELMFEIEDKYGIHIPNSAPTPNNIGELMELIKQYKPASA